MLRVISLVGDYLKLTRAQLCSEGKIRDPRELDGDVDNALQFVDKNGRFDVEDVQLWHAIDEERVVLEVAKISKQIARNFY